MEEEKKAVEVERPSLGQIAYAAYCGHSRNEEISKLEWAGLSHGTRLSWEAAGLAAADSVRTVMEIADTDPPAAPETLPAAK